MRREAVAYLRDAAEGRGDEAPSLDAQRAAVERFAEAEGRAVLGQYRETGSGARADWPALAEALAHAEAHHAALVIAHLGELARSASFLSALMRSAVEFVACDRSGLNRETVPILASVATDQAKARSERTRAALAAYKARGGVLGAARPDARRLSAEARVRGREAARRAVRAEADAAYADLAPVMVELRRSGMSLRRIADDLNARGLLTRRGKPWNPVQVARVLKRCATDLQTA